MEKIYQYKDDDELHLFMGFSGGWTYTSSMATGKVRANKSGSFSKTYRLVGFLLQGPDGKPKLVRLPRKERPEEPPAGEGERD